MSDVEPRVLVIEDERRLRLMVRVGLTANHYLVSEAETGQQGLAEAAGCKPDLVLLDIGLPDMDGLDVLRRLRRLYDVPVIVFSARGRPNDVAVAIEAGATDFLGKPFEPSELFARIEMALAKPSSTTESDSVFTGGDLRVEFSAKRVFRGGVEVNLMPIEYELMAVFAKHPGKLLTYAELITEVSSTPFARLSDVLALKAVVTNLRHKLEPDPFRPRYFLAELGVGYRFTLSEGIR